MRLFNNPMAGRLMLALAALFTLAQAHAGGNSLRIGNININDAAMHEVAVELENQDEVAALQFNIEMPDGMAIVGQPRRNAERFSPGQNMSYSSTKKLFLVTSGNGKSFKGNSGAICWITVQADPQALADGGELTIRLTNIKLSTASGQPVTADKETLTTVTLQSGKGTLSVAEPSMVVNPGATARVEVALENTFDAMGLNFDITLPAGFRIKNNDIHDSGRFSSGSSIKAVDRKNGTYGCVVVDFNGLPALKAGQGAVLWFEVEAPANFDAAKAEIRLGNLSMSKASGNNHVTINGEGCRVEILNGGVARTAVMADVASLEAELATVLDNIRTDCPLVSPLYPGTVLSEKINGLKNEIEEAYADLTLISRSSEFAEKISALSTEVKALEAEARASQSKEADRLSSNKAAYDAHLAAIAALQGKLDAAKAEIASKYAAFADTEAEAAAQSAVEALKADADAAFKAVENDGVYTYALDTAAAEAQIATLVTDAATRFEANRQGANKTAYDTDVAAIAALQAKLDAAKAEIASKYATFADTEAETAAQSAVEALKADADAAFKAVENEGVYNFSLSTAAVEAQIAALVPAASSRFEANRRETNKAAYDAHLAAIAALQGKLDAAKAEIASKYAAFADTEAEAAAQSAVEALKADADAAFKAVENDGVYNYALDTAAAEAQAAALVTDAAGRWAEANRTEANKLAYDADIARLDAIAAELDAAKKEVAQKYAGFANAGEEAAAKASLDALRSAVNKAYADVTAAGTYNYPLATDAVEAQIAALVPAAAARFETARLAGNKEARDAHLNAVAAVQAKLDAAKAEVASKHAAFADADEEAAAQAAVDALLSAVNAAFDAVAAEGVYALELDTADAEARIAALVPAAAARSEVSRKDANKLAYDADIARLDAIAAELDAAKAEIDENYEGFGNDAEMTEIASKIDAMKATVEKAYAAVANQGNYSAQLDTEAISARIAALVPAAAEAYRTDFNLKAFNADIEAIAGVKQKYDEAVEEIRAKYPERLNHPLIADMLNRLTAAHSACMLEMENVRQEGFYESPVDIEALEESVKEMLAKVGESSIEALFSDMDCDGCEIYTLDGMRHEEPVTGVVNVFRFKNGSIKKVLVK